MRQVIDDYRVELDSYCGPLDLLLYLVRRHQIDLHEIPMAKLADQYLGYLGLLARIDVHVAGEFLVMAATLLQIKSALLLPASDTDQNAGDTDGQDLDPRQELVAQLLAYKRFKDAAQHLDAKRRHWQARQPCRAALAQLDEQVENLQIDLDLEDTHALDLCAAFGRILETIGTEPVHEVIDDDTPIGLHVEDILDRLGTDGPMTLQAIFVGRTRRSELIGLFLAMLELVRLKKIQIQQEHSAGTIRLQLRDEADPPEADDARQTSDSEPSADPGEYDWPTAESRLRAERRALWLQKRNITASSDQDEPASRPDEPDESLDADPDNRHSD